jgi:hypothetical protein
MTGGTEDKNYVTRCATNKREKELERDIQILAKAIVKGKIHLADISSH